MTTEDKVLAGIGLYLAGGLATAGYSVYLYSHGRPRFIGLGTAPSAAAEFVQTILLWPYALSVNLKGG